MGGQVSQQIEFRIVSPELTVKALRDSGYKSTAHALAELIDNAIEADARTVEVFCVESAALVTERVRHAIEEIAVLDNGSGMDATTLRRALKFGDGTRAERRGIGRFGMGLPNSSMSQCTKVEVWSWQNGPDNALYTYLDLKEVKAGMDDVPDPVLDPLPETWRKLSEDVGQSGTLVLWSELDRVQWRGAAATLKNTESLIGRIYRRFIADGRVVIRLVPVRGGAETEKAIEARANDPLFLTAPSATPPPFDTTAMYKPFGAGTESKVGVQPFPIDIDGVTHTVTVRSSIAKVEARRSDLENSPWPEQYKTRHPGDTPWGKHAGRNQGISLVRADRELDLDSSWTNGYDPIDRWWGVEIDFPPALDEIFGVTNNKQSAMIFSSLSAFDWRTEADPGESFVEFKERLDREGDKRRPLVDLVYYLRDNLLRKMHTELGDQTKGTGTSRKRHDPATAQADHTIKRRAEEGHTGVTDQLGDQVSTEESRSKQVQNLTETHSYPREDAERQVDETLNYGRRCRMVTSHQPNSPAFFDVEFFPDVLQSALNMDHPAYEKLVEVLEGDARGLSNDDLVARLNRASDAFRLLLYAWARLEDEQPARLRDRIRQVRWDWGTVARDFLTGDDDED